MTTEQMPERITIHLHTNRGLFDDMLAVSDLEPGVLLPPDVIESEYVRADLAAGDAVEPLAEGQWRWALHLCGRWDVGRVDNRDGLCLLIDGADWYPEELVEIGPVIHPPANNAN